MELCVDGILLSFRDNAISRRYKPSLPLPKVIIVIIVIIVYFISLL